MTRQSAIAFAAWLQAQHPAVFKAVVKAAIRPSKTGLGDGDFDLSDVDFDGSTLDTSDFSSEADLSSEFDLSNAISGETTAIDTNPIMADTDVGGLNSFQPSSGGVPTFAPTGGLSSLLSAVGNFLTSPQGVQTVLGATAQIINTNAQAAAIQAQAARAAAGQLPANISYNSAGQPVLNTSTGQIALTPSQIQAMTPNSFLQSGFIYIILGAVALLYLTSEN